MLLRRKRATPIAIDIGTGSLKLIQVGGTDDRQVIAATERPVPVDASTTWPAMVEWLSTALPVCLDEAEFTGRKAKIALPAAWTTIQHIQMTPEEASQAEEIASAFLPELEAEPITKVIHVGEFLRNDQLRSELICMAYPRQCIFNMVELLHRHGMEVVDMRSQIGAMVSAFDHLHRRVEDTRIATMYVDLGTGGTNCAITNGADLVSARRINVGGRHFDQAVARHLGCDLEAARAYRIAHDLSEQETQSEDQETEARPADREDRRRNARPTSLGSPMAPLGLGSGGTVPDCPDLLETIVDELRMAIRYDAGLFPERSIERVVFLGEGARSDRTCRHIVQALQLPGQRGDPLARYTCPSGTRCPSNWNGTPRPSWAVAIGLLSRRNRKERLHVAA